jgi:cellulose biosynthesis protein BcsQ
MVASFSCKSYNSDAAKGQRVLVVDADSQANLTSFFMPSPKNWKEEQQSREEAKAKAVITCSVKYVA